MKVTRSLRHRLVPLILMLLQLVTMRKIGDFATEQLCQCLLTPMCFNEKGKSWKDFVPWLQKCTNGGSNCPHFYLKKVPEIGYLRKEILARDIDNVFPQEIYGLEDVVERQVNFAEIFILEICMSIQKALVI